MTAKAQSPKPQREIDAIKASGTRFAECFAMSVKSTISIPMGASRMKLVGASSKTGSSWFTSLRKSIVEMKRNSIRPIPK